MKKTLLLVFILGLLCNMIFSIKIPENIVSKDNQGNNIYQVDIGEIKIGFKVVGEGEPIILLMGLGGTFENWPEDLINTLSKKYQLIMPDNRGMGWSSDIEEKTFSYEILSEDVIKFMDAIELEKAHMIGYSMGSIFIQYILLNHNERVNKAVLNATSLNTEGVLESLYKNANAALPTFGPVKKQMDIVDNWKVNPEDFLNIENDILLTADNILIVENSYILSEYIKTSYLSIFEGLDHYLIFEKAKEFSYICIDFFEGFK